MTFTRLNSIQDAYEEFKSNNPNLKHLKTYNIATMVYCVWYKYYPSTKSMLIKLTHTIYNSDTGFKFVEVAQLAHSYDFFGDFESELKQAMYIHAVNYLTATCPLDKENRKIFLDKLRKSVL